ncbi:hypothetical protein M407DRAFT_77146, partial [Tulasnella calospora MUT 4182]
MSASSTFNTQEVRLWNNPQAQTSKTIKFPKTYVAAPEVTVGLNALDIQAGAVVRAKVYHEGIDNQKFNIHADTWADTTLYMAGADYLIKKPGDLDFQFGEFNTEFDHPLERPQAQTSCRINFDHHFVTPPKVVVFLKTIDAGRGSSTRIKTYTSGVDAKGFTIHIDTWADTILYRATAGWIAYPEDKEHIFSYSANTMDLRPWDRPQEKQQKDTSHRINFGRSFVTPPKVVVFFKTIDAGRGSSTRIKTYTSGVDAKGFTIHIDTWADTTLF